MAFRLDPAESVPDGVRRIAREQLDQSIHRLTLGTDDRDRDVHSARKSMKCLRGLVRLVRPDLGGEAYRRENETYRDTARRLAGLRDATVLVATLDRVAGGLNGRAGDLGSLREQLAGRRGRAYESGEQGPVLDACAEVLRQARDRVDHWPLEGAGWRGLGGGLLGVYRRGRREFDEASWRPSVESLHEWRKRVKYLWYHSRLLQPLWPALMTAWQKELDRLGELLGDDHDLAVLAGVLRQEGGPEGQELLASVSRRRHELQEEARVLGMRVYAERPGDLRRRLRGYWRAWEEERRRIPAPAPERAVPAGAPERVADTRCRTGEGPLWHEQERRLYWVDIPEGRLYRCDPASGAHEQVFQGEPIGGFTVQADGSLLLFMARGAVAVWRPDQPLSPVVEEIPLERESRFNDVVADPEGRVFCGTMPGPDGGGRLYRLDRDGTLTELLDGVGLPNGMDFSPDGRFLYFVDSAAGTVWRFDYDRGTGELSERRVFADTAGREGAPDGLAVDAEGGVWCALWGGGCLVRYRPDGGEDRRVELPARKVSSAAFGGPALDELYVTTAGGDDREAEGPGAGALFRLRPGLPGRPPFPSRIGL